MLDFGRPVVSFVPQPRLEQFAAAPSITNGRIVEVSLSYSLLRHPHRRDHPENLLPLSAEQDRAIRRAEEGDLPEWMIDQIRRMRYPVLWEAVRTAVTIPTERARPLEARLGAHMKDALRLMPGANSRSRKTVQLREEELTRGAPIGVDGETVRGIRVDGDPDVVALGFRLDERQVTVVIERALAPLVRQEFVRYVP
ncbi:hypothetical protein HQQ80_13370 [Microbacteriaceae bacterium VKM Ac-2855]|nr:hypothetical protein [Microbacteriaceae bacterium VKM Ac-2855]